MDYEIIGQNAEKLVDEFRETISNNKNLIVLVVKNIDEIIEEKEFASDIFIKGIPTELGEIVTEKFAHAIIEALQDYGEVLKNQQKTSILQ